MKRHQLRHNINNDAYANQSLTQQAHGVSRGVDNSRPGSEYTQCYPQLHVNPNKRLFPQHGYRIDNQEK